ncbi:factor H binding protein domain-containing protein, partial [uncultured Cardiobacterium sp.]|uniref:factor H binding protein domain-containing protein n=1 Tax=uncultured Cardiobacterium sp. TaxID=417619 RepID=UPI002617EED5
MKLQLLTALTALALLTACGGGGGDDNPSADKPDGNARTGKTYFMPDDGDEPDNDSAWRDFAGFTLNRNGNTITKLQFGKGLTVNTTHIPAGFAEFPAQMTIDSKNSSGTTENVNIRSYQGFHAGILAINGGVNSLANRLGIDESGAAYIDPTKTLPAAGKATYNGRAFDTDPTHDATLRYTIDFGARRGAGEITASRGLGRITLHEAPITRFSAEENQFGAMPTYGIEGSRTIDGKQMPGSYTLGIAGP